MSEPRMRHFQPGNTNHVETWWTKRGADGRAYPLRSSSLAPVSLPEGLEATVANVFKRLPKRSKP